ncbi:MAG: RNA polymerase sigma factor [Bryobacteraceae bacterium]
MDTDFNKNIVDRDEELLRAVREARDGDLRAFEQLVQQYRMRILADCRFLTRDQGVAEELAQEVFVKAYFGLRTFEGRSSFRHWLQRIKVHHCLNYLKKAEGKGTQPIDEESVEEYEQLQVAPVADTGIEAKENRQRIHDILNAMPAALRIPLVLRDMDELSYEEVAASLGIGLSAAKMRIKRAREQFRRRYQGEQVAAGRQAPA